MDSVYNQTFQNWRIIYIDDNSSDNTYLNVLLFIKKYKLKDKIILLKNHINYKQAYSRFRAFQYCNDNEICCLLDGDDWLHNNQVLQNLKKLYDSQKIEASYGKFQYFANNKLGNISGHNEFPKEIIKHKKYRQYRWISQHMRCGLAKHFKSYPIEYIKNQNNEYFSCNTDVNEMMWLLYHSQGNHRNSKINTYIYNKDASLEKNSYYNIKKYKDIELERYESENFIRLIQL